jgi:hypothetical protein
VSEAGQKTQGCDRGIDVQTGGEGYGREDREEFGERDLEEVQHRAVVSVSARSVLGETEGARLVPGTKALDHDRAFIAALGALHHPKNPQKTIGSLGSDP